MSRRGCERMADVRRLISAAQVVFDRRSTLEPLLVRTSGLTSEGVELGFASLERCATDADLHALLLAAGETDHVHVILSSNVFTASLRAIALARAAAPRVTVRPSPREPALARALVEAAGDPAITLVDERDVSAIVAARGGACEIHVYGRDATIAQVRATSQPGVVVRGHGAGMGVAVVTREAQLDDAAEALARDVASFDQRGCLSPRTVLVEGVEGHAARGEDFARALHERLGAWGERVPRGSLSDVERAEACRWHDTLAFAGRVWTGRSHVVALAMPGSPLTLPPPGRHVHVATERDLDAVFARLDPFAGFVVAVGTDDPTRVAPLAPAHARVGPLGRMQRPPLDGPVDRRGS